MVVSDLHLGARNARPGDLLRFLDELEPDQLFINGDLFDQPDLGRLGTRHVELIGHLRQRLSAGMQLRLLRGNHDPAPDQLHGLLGFDVAEELDLRVAGHRYLICHGDRWDDSLQWFAVLVNGAERIVRPGGLVGVVDFFVCAEHSPFTRRGWPAWFRRDGVHLGPERLGLLREKFEVGSFFAGRSKVPYLPLVRVPYFRFVGMRR